MKVIMILFALLFSTLAKAAPLHNIVAFGDSLSDNGNLYEYMQHRMPLSPPYFEGRFTNGPVWVEHLVSSYFPTDSAAHLLDYAFGGAGILEESDDGSDDDALFTLKHEIDAYLIAHQDKADSQSLFTVWIGANNYLAVPDDIEKAVDVVNTGITRGLERLAKSGAKHILLINLPDLGKTPAARDFEAEEHISSSVKRHNEALANSMSVLQQKYPDVQWIYFDVSKHVDEVLASPEKYGFTNIKDTCYDILVDKPSQVSVLKMAAKIKMKKTVDSCDGYLFFDPVHTTVLAHQLIAERVRTRLDELGVEFAD